MPIINRIGGGASGGRNWDDGIIKVMAPIGSVITATDGTNTLTAEGHAVSTDTAEYMLWIESDLYGEWTVNWLYTEDGIDYDESQTVNVTDNIVYDVEFVAQVLPEFTYAGTWMLVDDDYRWENPDSSHVIATNSAPIPTRTNVKNWCLRLLSGSNTNLNFSALGSAKSGIDVFIVAGGGSGGKGTGTGTNHTGGGGAGGKTGTYRGVSVNTGTDYPITIGGGSGNTTAFGHTATAGTAGGGASSYSNAGGNGGSGGGGSGSLGGTNGANGGGNGGTGQGTTTREFEDSTRSIYAGGGSGGGNNGAADASAGKGETGSMNHTSGVANTGGGGGGGKEFSGEHQGRSGGSGIVVIRNRRA